MKKSVIQLFCIFLVLGISAPVWAQDDPTTYENEAFASSPYEEDVAQAENNEDLAYVEDNREAVIFDIVERWRETMDARQGTEGWAEELFAALESAPADKLLAVGQARTYDEVGAALFGRWQGPDAQVLAPGDVPAAFGSISTDLVFTPLTPCRIIDTRYATGSLSGRITANAGKQFQVNLSNFSAQGGTSGSCGIPTSLEVSAVVLNVASTDQTGTGHIRVIPTGGGIPTAALVNYTAGVNISNSAVVRSQVLAGNDIFIYSGVAASHVVVDLMGYFAAPNRTRPDYYRAYTWSTIATGLQTAYSGYCASGYEWVSAGAQGINEGVYVNGFGRNGTLQRSFCTFRNLSGSSRSVTCAAHCIRIPGR